MAEAFMLLVGVTIPSALIWLIIKLTDKQAIRDAIREADIERQIQSLRRHADHAVATRPRVRAGQPVGCNTNPRPTYKRPAPPPAPPKPKACGGGLCRHRADCSDTYCPGRQAASLSTTKQP